MYDIRALFEGSCFKLNSEFYWNAPLLYVAFSTRHTRLLASWSVVLHYVALRRQGERPVMMSMQQQWSRGAARETETEQ